MLALILAAALGGGCANPSILSANVQSVSTNGALNYYTLAINVQNQGYLRQPSDLLASVDVFQAGQRVDQLGLQPLGPGQSQRVQYTLKRSVEAGAGSTDLTFALDFNGRSGNNVDCRAGTETFTISV